MRKPYPITLILCCLLFISHAAWADGVTHVAFYETFDQNNGTGGKDAQFSGNIALGTPVFDAEGWTGNNDSKIYGAKECISFGTADEDGTCTTPEIVLVGTSKTARLRYCAAGWLGEGSRMLKVTANDGVTLEGSTDVTLTPAGSFTTYTVLITLTTAKSLQLTFTGRRGFLDYVEVTETVTAINAPTLPDEFQFWPKTTEANATTHVSLVPSDSTTVYYTTDGSEPSASNGVKALLTTNVAITGTTTVKARAYYETVASDVVSRTYRQGSVTVNSISDFKMLDNDTEARLFLSADAEARVLHAHDGKQLYLRDKTGALCLDFGETATFNPAPAHNQHVAGWIVGRKTTNDGLTKLVATANTNTNYLALAAPVTEAATQPTEVYSDEGDYFELYDYVGDWVKVNEARTDADITIENTFGTDRVANTFVYRQLVDVSGIVLSNTGSMTKVAPVAYNDIKPVVYVINEDKIFVSPSQDIQHATIRLKRTLSKDYWNTFVVPFNIFSLDGEIREYNELNGSTMHFDRTDQMMAGVPYLVKPKEDIVNPVFSDVTLSATAAAFVDRGGDYYFVGTYSPKELETDKTELFLKTDGKLYYPSEGKNKLKGMRAYFCVPTSEAGARVMIDGEATSISEELRIKNEEFLSGESVARNATAPVYDLQGRKVSNPTKGVYIVNGKKIIIQ